MTTPSSAPSAAALTLLVAGTFFMENLDATVIAPALPRMAESFGVAPVDLNTGISAYMLTLGVLIPASGWISERFGARRVFACAIALFTLASLLCAQAASLPQFVAARVLQGAGGAMMVPVGRLAVLRTTPKEKLIGAIALLTWPALVAPVLGPPLGGLLVDHADWRWVFYLNLPLGLLAFAAALRLVPALPGARQPFDWPGFVLLGAGLACLLWATEEIGHAEGNGLRALVFTAIGVALLGLGIRHLRRARAPMLTLHALGVPTFAVAIWGGSLFRMGINAIPFLVPLQLQLGLGFDAFGAGAVLMAVFAGNIMIKPLTTPVLRRFGFKPVLVVNGVINALAIGACALFGSSTPLPLMCAVLFIGGMTRSMQFTAFNTLAFADVPAHDMAGANTLFSTAFQLAMGLGVALGALALRSADALSAHLAHANAQTPFHIAFAVVALVSLAAIADSLRLPRDAGAGLARR